MERAEALKVNAGTEPDTDLGPVISKQVSTYFWLSFPTPGILLLLSVSNKYTYTNKEIVYSFTIYNPLALEALFLRLIQTGEFSFSGKGTNMQINSDWC